MSNTNEKKPLLAKFSKDYTFKVLLLIALVLLLLIPIRMIRSLVWDREETAREAEKDMMEAWGGELIVAGPVISMSGTRTRETFVKTEKGGESREVSYLPLKIVLTPKILDIKAEYTTEIRKRGIFSVPLFSGELTLTGTFDPAMLVKPSGGDQFYGKTAELVITLSGLKGIKRITAAEWNGEALFFQPGSLRELFGGGRNRLFMPLCPNSGNKKPGLPLRWKSRGGGLSALCPSGRIPTPPFPRTGPRRPFKGTFFPIIPP